MAKVSLRAYNREIETMIDRGQLDEAIAHCHHILKTFPKHLETYRLLGKAYLEGKRYGEASDIFLRILASVPDDFVAQVGMSIIRDEQNKLDDAIWHMERAFETQPSNPAIQSELQRLYGRRDGVQPPRIRMTRGALAHMYVQGELYPQAISEIKSVLKDDAGRADMQALLARASYKSGLKNEAADVASTLLRRYPYSLDANRVLTEILGMEKPENAQIYRQRVVELDPYASQVMGTVFQSIEVPEAAVSIERLDWNGQPVSMQSDWGENRAIGLESGIRPEEEADWFKTPQSMTPSTPSQPTAAPIFDTTAPAQPAEEIPDFLRAAGWGTSTGAFDESKSAFAEEETTIDAQPIEQGDLPDWVKAMKPAETEPEPAAPAQDEELPDWINNIGKGALSSEPTDMPDWLNQPEQSSSTPASESLDWMNQTEQTPSAAMPGADEQPDWLKNIGQEAETTPSASPAEEFDWLKGLGSESDFTPQPAETETPDWLKDLGSQTESVEPPVEEDKLDWLKDFNTEAEAPTTETNSADFDFLNQLTEEPLLQTPESTSSNTDNLGMSEQEQDDSFAWLESLAAKQGASEGLLTNPEDRLEEEPEWVKQAKGLSSAQPPEPVVNEPSASFEELGKSEQEQDDSFAWLESLAAKQGATEGLLTNPEDRLEEEPEWVRQAKSLGEQQPPTLVTPESEQEQPASIDETPDWLRNLGDEAQPVPEPQQPAKVDEVEAWLQDLEGHKESEPTPAMDETAMWLRNLDETPMPATPASVEELGKSEQEQDDSFAWLESLAAKQGATEGLLTKPEDRLEQEPEWVKQAKDLSAQQPPTPVTPEPEPEEPAAIDETAAWLRSLADEEKQPEPAADETATWLKNLDEAKPESFQAMESSEDALPAWMQNIEQEESPAAETVAPTSQMQPEAEMQPPAEEPVAMEESKLEEENIPSWLAELDKEEEKPVSASADEDLPSWLRAEETAPSATERTQPSDWKPAEEQPEIIYSPPLEEPKQPEIIYSPPLEEVKEPEPVAEKPPEQPVQVPEPPKVEPKPAPTSAPERYKEPVTRRTPSIPTVDPVLGSARTELSRSNIPGALESYAKLIKRGRFLDEVIYDLREALYRYPVEVNIWQSLGDAYMRANRLQDALDSYTKAEELLR